MRFSRSFRWTIRLSVLSAAAIVGACFHFTRPAALRAALEQQARRAGVELIGLEDISFSPWGGLRATGVQLRVPNDPGSPQGGERAVLSMKRAVVSCRLSDLLFGSVTPQFVEVQDADLSLFHAPGQAWRSADSARMRSDWQVPDLPAFVARRCDVRVNTFDPDGRSRLLRRWVVTAQGAPTLNADGSGGYRVTVDTTAGARLGPAGAPRAFLDVQLSRGSAQIDTDWFDLELAALLLPVEWANGIQSWVGSGRWRFEDVALTVSGDIEGAIRFAGLDGAVPIENQEIAAAERYLQVRDGAGLVRVTRRGDALTARRGPIDVAGELTGKLNGADATLIASVRLTERDAAAHSIDQASPFLVERYEVSGHIDPTNFPDRVKHAEFTRSPRLPGALRAFFNDYQPAGLFSLDFSTRRAAGDIRPTTEAMIEAHGARCRYKHFPYDIDQVFGRVRHTGGGTVLEGLRGRHGNALITADGRIFSTHHWTGFDLRFSGQNVALDRDLYSALPRRDQVLWEQARPLGVCDVAVNVRRAEGSAEAGPQDPNISVVTRMLAGSIDLQAGQRLEHVWGTVGGGGGLMHIDLSGHLDQALARLHGDLATRDEQTPPLTDLALQLAGHRIWYEQAVTGPDGERLGVIQTSALADIWGRVQGDAPGVSAYRVRISDGTLRAFDPTSAWTGLTGWVTLQPAAGPEFTLDARGPLGRVEISASLPGRDGADIPTDLRLAADGPAIERLLTQLIPARWASIREALNLSGPGSVSAEFRPPQGDGLLAEIRIEAATMRPTPLPLPLRNVKGVLLINESGFELSQAGATHAPDGAQIVLSGHGGWSGEKPWTDLQVEANGLAIVPDTIDALPKPVARLLTQLSLQGRAGLHLDRLRFEGSEIREWMVKGRLDLDEASLQLGLPLTGFAANVNGVCRVLPDGDSEMSATFDITGGKLAGRAIERIEGRIEQELGQEWLTIQDIRASMCGGSVMGKIAIDQRTLQYDVDVDLVDIDLHRFLLRAGAEAAPSGANGSLSGRISVRRSAGREFTGTGDLRIIGGSLLSTPVSESIVKESRRSRLGSIGETASGADLYFVLAGDVVHFNRVQVRTPERWLRGQGVWNQRTDEIDLTLVTIPSERALHLGSLTDLLLARELVQFRVTGTTHEPHVSAEVLYIISDAVRRMLEGD